ncbi:Cyclin-dependent kinase 5 [Strongyloides ratti]|uniref:Cyclin-dependent kinase 5 n=1 Tax=Strongyloides ratti TaxID=34506 RepID=A0A090L6A5_STRRB|nr:Cyclin-dependent kinase 5 [Strongyloides ratti]CEF65252.1 Cyclin-dependent kinase 5 [Strongyloides ratti]
MSSDFMGDKKHLNIPFFDPTKPPPNFNLFIDDGNLLNTPFAPPELKKSFGENVILKSLRRTSDVDTQLLTPKIISPVKAVFTSPIQPPPPPMPNLVLPPKPITPQNTNNKQSNNTKMDQIDKAFINKAIAPLELKKNCTNSNSTSIIQSLHSAPPYENKNSKNCFFRYKTKQNIKKLNVPSSVPIPSLRPKTFNFNGRKISFTNKEMPEKSLKPILRDTGNDYKYIQQNKYFDNALSAFQIICLEENKNEAIKTSLKAHHRILEYKECFVLMKMLNDSSSKLYKYIKNGLDKKYLIKELYNIIEEKFKKQEFKSVTHPRISIVYNIVKEYEKIIEREESNLPINDNYDENEIKPYRQGSENIRQFIKEKNPKEVVAFYKKRNEDLDKNDKKYVNIKDLVKLLKKRNSCELYSYKQNDPLVAVIKKVRELTKSGVIERLKIHKVLVNKEKNHKSGDKLEKEKKDLASIKAIVLEKEIQLVSNIFNNTTNSDKVLRESLTNKSSKFQNTPYNNFMRVKKIFNDIRYETKFKDANNFKPLYKIFEDGGTRMFYVIDRIDKKRCILKEYLNFGSNENLIIQFKSEIECLVKNRERMFEPILGFALNLRLNRLYIGYGINNNTLEKVVKDDNYVPDISFIRFISQQIIEGLYHLERIGIVHKDIKPGNIFVKSDNKRITIGNFHYSSYIKEPNNLVYNDKSYNYRALEAYIEPLKLTHAVDMWGAGCVIYEMCTGGFPLFEGNTPLAVVGSIYKVIGAPSRELCHGYDKIFFYRYIHFAKTRPTKLNFSMQSLNPYLEDFFNKIFTHNGSGRIKPYDALFHPYLEDISGEGMKTSEKWHMKYEKLKDHSLKFEKQVRYINLLIEKLKEQQDRRKEISNDISKIMLEKLSEDTEEFLRLKNLNRKRKCLPNLNILPKKKKLTLDDVKILLNNIKPSNQFNVKKLLELYKGKNVLNIFVTKPLFRRILIRTGRISVSLAYELLARIETGKLRLKDVKSSKIMRKKIMNIQASEKIKREKRILKVKKLNKNKLKKSKKSINFCKKNDENKKVLNNTKSEIKKNHHLKSNVQCKKKSNLQSFIGGKKIKLKKKPIFVIPKLPKNLSKDKNLKNSESNVDKVVKNKQKLKKEKKIKEKSSNILEFPSDKSTSKKNDNIDKMEKSKELEKLPLPKNLESKVVKSTKPFPQCLMPDDEPCSSKSIVKAKDKPWYEIKTMPSLPYDKAPKIYIPPDTQVMPKRTFNSIHKQLRKNSNKSSHKSQTIKPLKIPPVLTPAERIQKLKAQTPLFSPPNLQQFSKPSPTISHLYNQLSNNKSSPALKSTDLISDNNPFRKDRLDRDLKRQSLTIKDRLFERITTPPKPPNLVFSKNQPFAENEGTIKNLLIVEKDKIQKKIDD